MLLAPVFALTLPTLTGCSASADDGLPGEHVWGRVNFQGKPLERGTIQFLSPNAHAGLQIGGMVEDGAYSVE